MRLATWAVGSFTITVRTFSSHSWLGHPEAPFWRSSLNLLSEAPLRSLSLKLLAEAPFWISCKSVKSHQTEHLDFIKVTSLLKQTNQSSTFILVLLDWVDLNLIWQTCFYCFLLPVLLLLLLAVIALLPLSVISSSLNLLQLSVRPPDDRETWWRSQRRRLLPCPPLPPFSSSVGVKWK